MKLSVNEGKLTGLWARNFVTIQRVLISKFAFGPEKLSGLSRKLRTVLKLFRKKGKTPKKIPVILTRPFIIKHSLSDFTKHKPLLSKINTWAEFLFVPERYS